MKTRTDLSAHFNKTKQLPVLETLMDGRIVHTDDYVHWLEDLALQQVSGVVTSIEQALNLDIVIKWVAISDKKPDATWGDYLVCLKNGAITRANYCTIGIERWLVVGVGKVEESNPVKYWAELPEPPCL
jgi:hypothetical protein